MAMGVMENGYLFFNLGWYFQNPLFEYLYTGIDRVALANGVPAITGNPDLEPERSAAWEASFRYILPFDLVASVCYFKKESTNLTDTKTFLPGDSKLVGSYGFAEFVNSPYAYAHGWEFVLTRERGRWVTGELSYTYLETEGISGSAYDGYYIAQYGLPPDRRIAPLSWDQRHAVKAQVTVALPGNFSIAFVGQWHSGRPYTSYLSSTGYEEIDGGRFFLNNERMHSFTLLDIRAEKHFPLPMANSGLITLFADIRNLTDQRNILWVDSNDRIGGELSDPGGVTVGRRIGVGIQVSL
jgi:outer membrane receptor protein involved in Fe transport